MEKLGRKEMPSGYSPTDFKYMGRPAKDQGDFGADVGIGDMACVNQFGEANNAKGYHGGVVQSTDGKWWCYFEWGRIKPGKSWNGNSFTGAVQDFQFYRCDSESDARSAFRKQMESKNTKRLVRKDIGGAQVWTSKEGDDGYIVQALATREKGLPDALLIKDDTGVTKKAAASAPSSAPKAKAPSVTYQAQVVQLANALVGGTKTYTKALSAATGVVPTMAAITQVRDQLIPAALDRIAKVGNDISLLVRDKDLQAISKMVFSLVPRDIPRSGLTPEQAILSSGNLLSVQADLDAFEAALGNENFEVDSSTPSMADPSALLNAQVRWLDLSKEGKSILDMYVKMTNNRHYNLSGAPKVRNIFEITRPDRDAQFLDRVQAVAAKRKGQFSLRAGLQPRNRPDLGSHGDLYGQANVIFTQHGTRSVNIHPIVSTHFRLPKSLSGVPIAGANFGHGNYQATDLKKAAGYASLSSARWSGGGGGIAGRGAFMFLCDTIMGDAYRAPSTGSWTSPPNGKDSVFGVGGDRGHMLENDEHVVFDPHYVRIRYLVEFEF